MKTGEDAPLAMLMITEICQKHPPAGVVNVITGYGEEAGAPLEATTKRPCDC
jgi:aldehyde dehydrogenase (NAD+)